jgi:NADH:ubiquinone oxidoreductase subunit 6 (subunit J)
MGNLWVLYGLIILILYYGSYKAMNNNNPIYAVLFLIVYFLGGGMFLFYQGLFFLGFLVIIIYASAVAIFFLFFVMMVNVDMSKQIGYSFGEKLLISSFLGYCIFFIYSLTIYSVSNYYSLVNNSVYNFSANSQVILFDSLMWQENRDFNLLGSVLYTKYFSALLIMGLILLFSMVGAIALTRNIRRQRVKNNGSSVFLYGGQSTITDSVFFTILKEGPVFNNNDFFFVYKKKVGVNGLVSN